MMSRSMLKSSTSVLMWTAIGAVTIPCGSAAAQDVAPPAPQSASSTANQPAADAGGIPDIVVTAERRTSTVQRTPIAVTALTGDLLGTRQLNAITDIQGPIPNFRIGILSGGAVVSIRGIGITNVLATSEGAAAVNLNDVYIARVAAQPLSFYDVSAIEVLRGPQGTLYGRNATAGAVNIRTTMPTNEVSGYARVTLGNYNTTNFEGAVGGALVDDKLLVRVAGRMENHSGYATNFATGNKVDDRSTWAARGTVVIKPAEDFTATLIVEAAKQDDNSGALHLFGGGGLTGLPGASGLPPYSILAGGFFPGLRHVNNQLDPVYKIYTLAATAKLEWELSDHFTLRSISGYRYMDNKQVSTIDDQNPSVLFYALRDAAKQYSQEFQALYSSSLVDVTLGGYYFHERERVYPSEVAVRSSIISAITGSPTLPGDPFTDAIHFRALQKVRSLAAFGQVNVHVTDQLTVTGGLRYTSEVKKIAQDNIPNFSNTVPLTPPFINFDQYPALNLGPYRRAKFTSTTPKLGIQYQATPNILAYASFSKGFKSGGFELGSVTPAFRPEKLTDYEGGIKAKLFDNKVTMNLAGFYYDYSDLQVQATKGVTTATVNAGKARLYGLEAEINAIVTDAFSFDLSGAYLNSKYKNYIGVDPDRPGYLDPRLIGITNPDTGLPYQPGEIDYSGNRLSNAPKLSGQLGAEYLVPLPNGKLTLRGEMQYMSKYYLTPVNVALESQSSFVKGNLFLTYASDDHWRVQLFVRNISNKITRESYQSPGAIAGNPFGGSVSAPRLMGIDFNYSF